VFENRVLRMYGPKRDDVTEELRNLHNEELRDLYSSPSIIRMIKSRKMRWAGHVTRIEERNANTLSVAEPEGMKPLGRPRRTVVDSIKVDLGETGWNVVDGISLRHQIQIVA
jgi:hypothetical protein